MVNISTIRSIYTSCTQAAGGSRKSYRQQPQEHSAFIVEKGVGGDANRGRGGQGGLTVILALTPLHFGFVARGHLCGWARPRALGVGHFFFKRIIV